jgi:hypothetical protein
MKLHNICRGVGFLLVLSLVSLTFAQTSSSNVSALPRLVRFGSTITELNGKPMTGVVGITFALYSEQTGGAPLWLETQNVRADANGHYTVLLGSTKPDGLPAELFASEQAHWVGIQASGQPEEPRVLLVSAPYALKAGDAETLGGLPPSAFMLAVPPNGIASPHSATTAGQSASPPAANDVTTAGGTVNYLPIFNGASTVIDSVLFQSGTGTTAKIGVNTATPTSTLDVKGGGTIRGILSLPTTGVATASAGKNSQTLSLAASAFNSTSSTALNQTFHLQAEPSSNGTAAPSGTLNLLFGEGATAPSETGLKISSQGLVTFAPGQTFPGTGAITGITTAAGSGLTGGANNGTPSLSLLNTCAKNQVLQWSGSAWACASSGTVTSVATGAGLAGGPITGTGTLSIAPGGVTNAMLQGAYAQLGAANAFTGSNTFSASQALSTSSSGPVLSVNQTAAGDGVDAYTSSTTASAVYGNATAASSSGAGVLGTSSSSFGYGVQGQNTSTNGSFGVGVLGQTTASDGYGVEGVSPYVAVFGQGGNLGVYAEGGSYGVEGIATGTTGGRKFGVTGSTSSSYGAGVIGVDTLGAVAYLLLQGMPYGVVGTSFGVGVYGAADLPSNLGQTTVSGWQAVGVWGDTGGNTATGGTSGTFAAVAGTADNNFAGYFVNSGSVPALVEKNDTTATHNTVFQTNSPNTYSNSRHCTIDTSANLTCTGVVSGVIQGINGQQTAVYAMQSAENWLEDAGSGQLSNGSARIELDPAFAQTVNAGVEYHVFLTPKGDSDGLYVSNETPQGFEVHEQHGGRSSIAFDYRIMAKRKGYENVRLEDLTERLKQPEALREKVRRPPPSALTTSVPTPTRPVRPLVAPRPVAPMPVLPKAVPLPHPAPRDSKPEATQK